MLMAFEVYYIGFGQAIASFSPNDLLASILVPIFFLFVVSFCGVVVPYAALPTVRFRRVFTVDPRWQGRYADLMMYLSFGNHGCIT